MSITETRLDAAEIGVFLRKLEDYEQQVDRLDFPDQPFADGKIVPLQIQNKPWARESVYHQVTHVGHFKLARNYTTSIPTVEVLFKEFRQKIHKWVSGYRYSEDDMAAVVRMGKSLDVEKIYAVQEAGRQELNELIAFGDRSIGMPGFINHPAVLRSVSPFALNATSTPIQALAVLNDAVNSVVNLTRKQEKPNTLLLPLSVKNYYSNLLIRDNSGGMINKTVLRHFLDENDYITDIESMTELEAASLRERGLGNRPIMMVYDRNMMKVKGKIYQPISFSDPRPEGVDGFVRPAKFKYAGIQFRRPYSCHVVELPQAA